MGKIVNWRVISVIASESDVLWVESEEFVPVDRSCGRHMSRARGGDDSTSAIVGYVLEVQVQQRNRKCERSKQRCNREIENVRDRGVTNLVIV